MNKRIGAAALAAVLLSGCAVGPNYRRPNVPLPTQFRGADASWTGSPEASIAETKWANLFGDETLNKLISTALERNFDLRIAAERVEQARANVGIARAPLFPFVNAQAGFVTNRQSRVGSIPFAAPGARLNAAYTQVGAALNWELDVWGRIRRLTESARAQYLASEEGRRGVLVSLIADVTSTYFQLLEFELELDISRRTRDTAEQSLRLVRLQRDRGAATGLDVRQAEQLLYTATAEIEAVERAITQTENALSLLLAEAPAAQPTGQRLDQVPVPQSLPEGLPSALLERRPDIRAAEQNLIAANAEIGAARALYFPQITLTGFAGGQSRALTEIATTPARFLTFSPLLNLPLFQGGRIRSQVRLTEAQARELVVTYEKTIYTALREVSDSLVAYERTKGQREQQQLLVQTLSESVRLSTLRYRGGLDSYLQVLFAQRNLFSGELVLARLLLDERLAVVQLYRALGGGWQ
ncbi:MAG TPA: efflux transporter outer membrane subunit, partial [Bryobacteraceae bacterium]|nr:efflux transporter outer membrane subunit [Bryobacteraceae bacterium]